MSAAFEIEFPAQPAGPAGEELVDVAFADGRAERLRLHQYDRLYAVPGLYEAVVQDRLDCQAPSVVAALLVAGAERLGWAPADVRVLDLGAGNGVSGEAQVAAGLRPVAAVDILASAREAALRDRPGLYGSYLAADLTDLTPEAEAELRAHEPNAIAIVGAVGGGHLPPAALYAAVGLLAPGPALLAYVADPDHSSELAAMLAAMGERGQLQELAREGYRHRRTAAGGERHWDAVLARIDL